VSRPGKARVITEKVGDRRSDGLLHPTPLAQRPYRRRRKGATLPDWEDPGYRYIWSNEAAQQLADLGIENSEAVITKVAAAYARARAAGGIREPERFARTMVHHAGLSALRASTVPHMGSRLPIVELSHDPQAQLAPPGPGSSAYPRLHEQPPEELYEQLRKRLRRDQEQADHRSKLEQLRRRLAEQLAGPSRITCPLHERGCPQDEKVLLGAHELIVALGNALDQQENGTWEPNGRRRRAHHGRTGQEWDLHLNQRLLHLVSLALATAGLGNSQRDRQAKSRLARCVLHLIWFEAEAVEFKFLAQQAGMAVECVYDQRLRRRDVTEPVQRRLTGWLGEHQQRRDDTEGEE
jgi:hypothetical protein